MAGSTLVAWNDVGGSSDDAGADCHNDKLNEQSPQYQAVGGNHPHSRAAPNMLLYNDECSHSTHQSADQCEAGPHLNAVHLACSLCQPLAADVDGALPVESGAEPDTVDADAGRELKPPPAEMPLAGGAAAVAAEEAVEAGGNEAAGAG